LGPFFFPFPRVPPMNASLFFFSPPAIRPFGGPSLSVFFFKPSLFDRFLVPVLVFSFFLWQVFCCSLCSPLVRPDLFHRVVLCVIPAPSFFFLFGLCSEPFPLPLLKLPAGVVFSRRPPSPTYALLSRFFFLPV